MPQKPRTRSKGKKAGQKARQRGSAAFGALADGLGIGLAVCDSAGRIRSCNSTFRSALEISASLRRNVSLLDRLRSDSRGDFECGLSMARSIPVGAQLELLTRDGHVRTFRVFLSPVGNPGPNPRIWILAHEITDLLETGRALDDSKGSVSFLSARLMQAQDAERRRMARDLHDITGQELAVILMSLSRLSNNIGAPGLDAKAELREIVTLARKVENEIRTLSYLLHPPMLDELGLKSALGWYIEGFTKRSKIQVQMDIPEALPRLSRDKEIAIFRVVQESLTNVLRHAHSSSARIGAEAKGGQLVLFVEDAGQGFPASPPGLGKSKVVPGVGIYGMRERLQQLGGRLTIESTPHGTQVRASVPLGDAAEESAADEAADATAAPPAEPASANGTARRILIVDDHELLRVGVRSILGEEAGLEVCGEAVDGFEAVAKARALKPDLVIMDLLLPRLGGFLAAQKIRELRPSTKILVFSNCLYGQIGTTLRMIGCDGYVSKARASTDLILAIRAVLAGEKFFATEAVQTESA